MRCPITFPPWMALDADGWPLGTVIRSINLAALDAKPVAPAVQAERPKGRKPPPKASKYHNTKTTYNKVKYDSRAEADRAIALDQCVIMGTIKRWIPKPSALRLGCHENVYRPDYHVIGIDGSERYEDVKGMETPKFKRDVKLWRQYGPCDLWLIKGKRIEAIDGAGGLAYHRALVDKGAD
jgi:hypothetical protein